MNQIKLYRWKACVHSATYNHAAYIRDTLNGICKQETSFPFVNVVVDDASSDGEHDVIMGYLQEYFDLNDPKVVKTEETEDYTMIYAQHKSNRNCFIAFYQLKYNHGSKKPRGPYYKIWDDSSQYIARCEGDDYWTVATKLQEQVDILDSNPEYTLVHTGFEFINDKGDTIEPPEQIYKDIPNRKKDGYIWQNHLVLGTPILLCTIMSRQGLIDEGQPNVDYNQFMSYARKGKIAYIEDKMSAYRVLQTSMMRTQRGRVNTLIKNGIFWQLFYFSNRNYYTLDYYKKDLRTRIFVSEAIISSLMIWKRITVKEKYKKLFFILFSRPLNTLLLPVALCYKIRRKLKRKHK